MTVIRMNSCNSHVTVRVDTHRVQVATTCCDGTCAQGRHCPQIVNKISPFAGVPKGKPVNLRSSSWTGRFPRTLSAAFGCSDSDPVYPMREPSSWQRFMAWLSGMSK